MTIIENLCPASKYSKKCPYSMTPEGICIHNTANDATAANEIKYMLSNNNQTSFHYAVDDKTIVHGIPDNRNAWHAGDGGSGKGNRKYISIEICYSKSGGSRFETAMKNAAWLTAKLLKEHGWDISHVKKHQDFSGKYCPHRILDDYGWDYYLNLVKQELGADMPALAPTFVNGTSKTYTVKVNTDSLNVRNAPNANNGTKINTVIQQNGVYTIIEVRDGWGLLKSGAGWINLSYTIKMSEKTTPASTIKTYQQGLETLQSKSIIDTIGYWTDKEQVLQYLPDLIIKMANTNVKPQNVAANNFTNVNAALDAMCKTKVINTPDYWKNHYSELQHLDTLILKFANRLWV